MPKNNNSASVSNTNSFATLHKGAIVGICWSETSEEEQISSAMSSYMDGGRYANATIKNKK